MDEGHAYIQNINTYRHPYILYYFIRRKYINRRLTEDLSTPYVMMTPVHINGPLGREWNMGARHFLDVTCGTKRGICKGLCASRIGKHVFGPGGVSSFSMAGA